MAKTSKEEKIDYVINRRIAEDKLPNVVMTIPFIPPSVNDLYFNNPRTKGRSLTTEGKVFKRKVTDYVVTNYLPDIQKLNPKAMFSIMLQFHLSPYDVFTKSYGEDKDTQSPFKRKDVGNLEKVIIDCIKELIMEDDCQFFQETLKKVPSDERKIEIWIYEEEPTHFLHNIGDLSVRGDILMKLDKYKNEANR